MRKIASHGVSESLHLMILAVVLGAVEHHSDLSSESCTHEQSFGLLVVHSLISLQKGAASTKIFLTPLLSSRNPDPAIGLGYKGPLLQSLALLKDHSPLLSSVWGQPRPLLSLLNPAALTPSQLTLPK